jgi:protein tyrosine phosphatase
MKQDNLTVTKISFRTLYLLILISQVYCLNEKELGQPFLNIYYQRVDAYVGGIMNNGVMPQSYFAKTFNFMQQSKPILQNMLAVEAKYHNEINAIKQSINPNEQPPREKIERLYFIEHLANTIGWYENELRYIIPNMRVTPRYYTVDSYLWNTISLDFVQNFDEPDIVVENNFATRFFYPASKISMPTWKNLGESMNLSMIPMPQNDYEFIAISAPVHNSLMVPSDMMIPKKIILNNRESEDLSGLNPNVNDMNMVYFFRLMVTQNIHMVIAICSDPEEVENPDDNMFKFKFDEDLSILNKCHLYWRVEFEMTFNNQKYTIKSEILPSMKTDLYNVYELTIKNTSSDFEHKTKVFVLSEWPDHQKLPEEMVPSQMTLYDIMFRHLSPLEEKPLERVMIHCSAGVGRTGTTILGYQMYVHLRMVAALDLMSDNTTFFSFIQNYTPTNMNAGFIKWTNDEMSQVPEFQKDAAKVQVFQKSRLIGYLMDSLMYYRLRRMWFVQTVDQFEFLIKFAWMLNIGIIKSHISPKGKVLSNEDPLEIEMEHMHNIYNPLFRENRMKLIQKNEVPKEKDKSPQNSSLKGSSSTLSSPRNSIKDEKSIPKPSTTEIRKVSSKRDSVKSESNSGSNSGQQDSTSGGSNQKLNVGGITISEERLKKLQSKLNAQTSKKDEAKNMLI